MQPNQLNNSYDLTRALQWLSIDHNVTAWKCVDNAVTILIEPTEHPYEPIIYGCTIKIKGE